MPRYASCWSFLFDWTTKPMVATPRLDVLSGLGRSILSHPKKKGNMQQDAKNRSCRSRTSLNVHAGPRSFATYNSCQISHLITVFATPIRIILQRLPKICRRITSTTTITFLYNRNYYYWTIHVPTLWEELELEANPHKMQKIYILRVQQQ